MIQIRALHELLQCVADALLLLKQTMPESHDSLFFGDDGVRNPLGGLFYARLPTEYLQLHNLPFWTGEVPSRTSTIIDCLVQCRFSRKSYELTSFDFRCGGETHRGETRAERWTNCRRQQP